jgi:hypothetical protein
MRLDRFVTGNSLADKFQPPQANDPVAERSRQDCNRYSSLLAGPLDLAGQVSVRV